MASGANTSSIPQPVCIGFDTKLFDLCCLGPSIVIIIILGLLVKRVHLSLEVCSGKPGLLIPVNFLYDSHKNRLTFAVAFGAIADSCLNLFLKTGISDKAFATPWWKAFYNIVAVLVYGIINYPIFACLMTEFKLIGAALGLAYSMIRFAGLMIAVLYCQSPENHPTMAAYYNIMFFLNLPTLLCHFVLLIQFSLQLYKQLYRKYGTTIDQRNRTTTTSTQRLVAADHDRMHVKLLLGNQLHQRTDYTAPWYITLKNMVYQPRPDFKFSTHIICTLAVVAVFIYSLTLLGIALLELLRRVDLLGSPVVKKIYTDFLIIPGYMAVGTTAVFAVVQMLHFVKCHRDHVLMSYRKQTKKTPSRLVGKSLRYSGYQVGYTGVSMLVVGVIMFIVFAILIILFVYLKQDPALKKIVTDIALALLPYVCVPLFVWIFQFLLTLFVFRDRQFPDITVTIDNQRLFCVMTYFLFLLNILVGVLSALMRCIKSMILWMIFLPRIDRTPLMRQYENWDKGYIAYLGFINVLKAYSHPVMLVFCQLLLNKKDREAEALENVYIADQSVYPVISSSRSTASLEQRPSLHAGAKVARNRWFLAKTLMSNPGLAKYRKTAGQFKDTVSLAHVDTSGFIQRI